MKKQIAKEKRKSHKYFSNDATLSNRFLFREPGLRITLVEKK